MLRRNNPSSMWAQTRPVPPLSAMAEPVGRLWALPPFCSWQGEPRTCPAGLAKLRLAACAGSHIAASISGRKVLGGQHGRARGHVSTRGPGPHSSSSWRQGRGWGHCGITQGTPAPACWAGGGLATLVRGVQPPVLRCLVQGEGGPGSFLARGGVQSQTGSEGLGGREWAAGQAPHPGSAPQLSPHGRGEALGVRRGTGLGDTAALTLVSLGRQWQREASWGPWVLLMLPQ